MVNYQEISPSERLKAYVKCYYLYESSSDKSFVDIVFPSGLTEVIFNLGAGKWQTNAPDQFVTSRERL